jgi:serine/threonine protein kinase
MAPEMHTALPYDGCKADVFALGVCLYTLANKSPPWKHTRFVAPGTLDENREEMGAHFERFVRNAHCNVSNHMFGKSRFSSQLTDLLNSMLAPEPARRLATASEVLAHPWFSGPQGAQTRARAAGEGDPAPMEEEPIYRGRLGDDDESDDDDKMEDDKEDPNIIRYRPLRQSKALP